MPYRIDPQTGQKISPEQTSPAGGLGGGLDLQKLLGLGALGKGQYGTAWNILKEPEAEKKRKLEKSRASLMSGQMDSVLSKWGKVPLLERLPIPGMGRVSSSRASYETARDAFNYFVITLAADKRITDSERQYWLKQFPPLLATKSVAKTKISELKNFINAYAGMEPPALDEEGQNIDDLLFQFVR